MTMRHLHILPCLAAALCFSALTPPALASASSDDTAKVLAGIPPSPGSPLESLTADAGWKSQAANFAQTWKRFEDRQLSHVRAWADRELPAVRQQAPVLYYTFSGPDVPYANTFFPGCRTYVLCGLEPVGGVPDLLALGSGNLGSAIGRLHASLKTVLSLSFFRTSDMGSDFRNPHLPGTTPVLMTFLARLGKNLRSVDLVSLDPEGNERPSAPSTDAPMAGTTPGVKISFDSGPDTPAQTLYYFSADLSGEGLAKNPGFANFCRKLEPGAGLVKAASYLMHTDPFAATRDFLMERCKFILQDDTGIPATVFTGRKWQVQPYGHYVRPIDMFRGYYQKELANIYAAGEQTPLDFGVGYYYRISDCNMVLAARDAGSVAAASVAPAPRPAPPEGRPAAVRAPRASKVASAADQSRKSLVELEEEELRIREDANLTKAERMRLLREIWKQQLVVTGKAPA